MAYGLANIFIELIYSDSQSYIDPIERMRGTVRKMVGFGVLSLIFSPKFRYKIHLLFLIASLVTLSLIGSHFDVAIGIVAVLFIVILQNKNNKIGNMTISFKTYRITGKVLRKIVGGGEDTKSLGREGD